MVNKNWPHFHVFYLRWPTCSVSTRHFAFVVSTARLFAAIYNISYSPKVGPSAGVGWGGVGGDAPPPAVAHISLISQDLCEEVVTSILSEVRIPEYSPSDKVSSAPGV